MLSAYLGDMMGSTSKPSVHHLRDPSPGRVCRPQGHRKTSNTVHVRRGRCLRLRGPLSVRSIVLVYGVNSGRDVFSWCISPKKQKGWSALPQKPVVQIHLDLQHLQIFNVRCPVSFRTGWRASCSEEKRLHFASRRTCVVHQTIDVEIALHSFQVTTMT